jgi:hypothetical protein
MNLLQLLVDALLRYNRPSPRSHGQLREARRGAIGIRPAFPLDFNSLISTHKFTTDIH